MPDPTAPRRLPSRPSREHLRKAAKRLAKARGLQLAPAQHRLANDYGFSSWAALMKAVDAASNPPASPLSSAAARGDAAEVSRLLAAAAGVEGEPGERDSPLFLACGSEAPAQDRLETARLLIEADAFTRRGCTGGATPLHAAASRGPAALVELLLRHGALSWQGDARGRRAYDYAESGAPLERERILYMLADGPKIEDPDFRAAVAAIHAGDTEGLARLLDAHPHLLTERAVEPDFGARGYFSDPKLLWFVANNPTLVPQPPANIVEIARLMIDRGVAREDLDYTLDLVMTDGVMPREMQMDLVRTLAEAGAAASYQSALMTLGHRQQAPIAWLAEEGRLPWSAAAAAGLGRGDALPQLLARASPEEKGDALAMAVINRQREAARLCLEAGADANRFMPCHSHSTPLHQAALDGDVEMMALLVAHGARPDIEDKLWQGTPLGWAVHGRQKEAESWLRGLAQ